MGAGHRGLSKDVSDHSPEECIWCPNQGRRAPDSRGFPHLQSCGGASGFQQNRKLPWSLFRPGTKVTDDTTCCPAEDQGAVAIGRRSQAAVCAPRLELKCPGLTPLPGVYLKKILAGERRSTNHGSARGAHATEIDY